MPELPEVETVRRGLAPAMEGRRIVRVDQRRADLRIPFPQDFVASVEERRVLSVDRRAKYLLAHLEGNLTLIMHLGMSGRFSIIGAEDKGEDEGQAPGAFYRDTPARRSARGEALGPHDHVVFDLEDGTRIVYTDHRRFGLMTLSSTTELSGHPLIARIGIEPLGSQLTAEFLNDCLRSKKTPIKAALLDQRLIAGLGNIYVCEALYYAGISPRRFSSSVPGKRAQRLSVAIPQVLNAAIEAGGSSLRDYAHTDGAMGYFQHRFAVYDREGRPCRTSGCATPIKRIVQSGRSSFYCPKCQR